MSLPFAGLDSVTFEQKNKCLERYRNEIASLFKEPWGQYGTTVYHDSFPRRGPLSILRRNSHTLLKFRDLIVGEGEGGSEREKGLEKSESRED